MEMEIVQSKTQKEYLESIPFVNDFWGQERRVLRKSHTYESRRNFKDYCFPDIHTITLCLP